MWLRVKQLMQGIELNEINREMRFNNEFDQFTTEAEESLMFAYNRFSQLFNDLRRNNIELPNVTINTKFLNCLQLEWYKYFTNVHYDDEYQRETFNDDQEDGLTSAMMLLARAITQRYSTPTNNQLRTFSNTRNQVVVQADRVNVQSWNVGNGGRIARRSYNNQEASTESSNCYNCEANGHYARDCPKPRVRDSKYFMEQMLLAKKDEAELSDFLPAGANQMEEI
ncbi:reverse transcriptase domain-containing protein [Tanacetum coccineum]